MVLTLQTSGMDTDISLFTADGSLIATKHWASGRELSDQLLAEIMLLITGSGHTLSQLTGIIIFSGPGSFTSLRIGHSVANALADSLNIPIVGTMGEDFLESGFNELKVSANKEPALPFYGAEANITKPKH